ncbi:MAG TPA: hypothetical protein VK973_12920 [Arenicellales bacterium]|nr:hypothetical protein [Arenicellales bacterium]
MTNPVHSFAERHPGMRDSVIEMAGHSTAFNDLCMRFARVWDSLNELENEPVDTERVRREVKSLEAEMLLVFQNQARM